MWGSLKSETLKSGMCFLYIIVDDTLYFQATKGEKPVGSGEIYEEITEDAYSKYSGTSQNNIMGQFYALQMHVLFIATAGF